MLVGVRRLVGVALVLIASYYGLSARTILLLSVLTLLFVFVFLPTFFHYNATVQRIMVFLPWVKWPRHVDFDKPEQEGITGAINYYLRTEEKVKVGVWHILPQDLISEGVGKSRSWFDESLRDSGKPIVLYLHGNTASRARLHRVENYRVLRKHFHVVCFDYRGYADSSRVIPTKKGVVVDAKAVYRHLRELVSGADVPIVVWGHSLGSAVASVLVSEVAPEERPVAMVLESPFNNIRDEIRAHPFSFLWRKMPFFDWFFTGSLDKSDVAFFSDKCIQNIHIPILIMHAQDDKVIPFSLGQKLYQHAKDTRKYDSKPVKFVAFHEDFGYGHTELHKAPGLGDLVFEFITKAISNKWEEEDY